MGHLMLLGLFLLIEGVKYHGDAERILTLRFSIARMSSWGSIILDGIDLCAPPLALISLSAFLVVVASKFNWQALHKVYTNRYGFALMFIYLITLM